MNIPEAYIGKTIVALYREEEFPVIKADSHVPGYGHIGEIIAYNEPGPSAYYTWFKVVNGAGQEYRFNSMHVHEVELK